MTTVQQIDAWRAAKSETEHLEFKEARNQFGFDDLLHYCVAIGNEGGGNLLLGISNKPPRYVVGTSAYPSIGKITEQLLNKLHFRVDVEEVNHPDGRVLVFHIPARPFRHAFAVDGAYYMRSGESLVPMTTDQLKKILNEPSPERRLGVVLLILVIVVATCLIGYKFWPHPTKPFDRDQSVHENPTTSGSVNKPEEPKPDETKVTSPKTNSRHQNAASPNSNAIDASKTSRTQSDSKEKRDSVQGTQLAAPQVPNSAQETFTERVIQRNKNSSAGDRERLANAFFEFSENLEQGRALMYKGFNEGGAIGGEGAGVAKTLQAHITKLRDLASSAKEYGKSNVALRAKWSYYSEQTQHVFGDNPDNLGWGKLANAFEGYANHLETWGVIQNKDDQRVLNILAEDKTQFETMLGEFSLFYQGCKSRLEDMKTSIQ